MGKNEENIAMLSTPLHGIYIPCALLIVGTAICKLDWVWYSVGASAILAAFKVWRGQPRKVLHVLNYKNFDLKEKTVLSHNTAIYRFNLPETNDILGLPIGQHVQISSVINGTEVVRSYTPVSSDLNRGYFDLLIKSYPTGNISKMFAELKIGQSIRVRGPKGFMHYKPNMVKAFGMIAGGTGITPMLQIIKAILRNPKDKTQIDFIFANVNHEDILLKEDLDDLAKEHPNQFRVHYVLNNPPEGWTGGVGFVTEDMIKAWCPAPAPDVQILICGPPPMLVAMRKATAALGFEVIKGVSKLGYQVFCF